MIDCKTRTIKKELWIVEKKILSTSSNFRRLYRHKSILSLVVVVVPFQHTACSPREQWKTLSTDVFNSTKSYATQFLTPQQLLLTQLAHDIFSLDDHARLKSLPEIKKKRKNNSIKKNSESYDEVHREPSISGSVGETTTSTKMTTTRYGFFSRHYHHRLYVHAQHYDRTKHSQSPRLKGEREREKFAHTKQILNAPASAINPYLDRR